MYLFCFLDDALGIRGIEMNKIIVFDFKEFIVIEEIDMEINIVK